MDLRVRAIRKQVRGIHHALLLCQVSSRVGPKAHLGSFSLLTGTAYLKYQFLPSFARGAIRGDQTIPVKQVDFFVCWLGAFDFSVGEFLFAI